MAVDAPNLERTTLERKDRAELVEIAQALGFKPPSRAKKSDIVEKILELAGVIPVTGDAAAPGNGSSEGSDDAAEVTGTPAAVSSGGDAPSTDAAASSSAEADRPGQAADAGPENTDDGARPGAATADAGEDKDETESANRRRRRRRGRERDRVEDAADSTPEPVEVSGLLDLRDDGYGFLRVRGFVPSRDDVYVSVKQCRQLGLRRGDHVAGVARPPGRQEKNPAMVRIEAVNGIDPEGASERVAFEDLMAVHPDEQLVLATGDVGRPETDVTGAVIDAVAPVGRGQRVLIAVPPAGGGPAMLRSIAHSVEQNHPDVHLIVLMVNERPEEVTDMRRSLESGEVVASTFDRPAEEHALVAELAVEHAKRLVEYGNDVVVILDGLHKLTRAHNMAGSTGGRTLPGGLESGAVAPAKRVFGAARNVEEGGSLTMFATAAVGTGSVVDGIVFDEFAPAASSILRLDRDLAAEGVVPALDLAGSETLHAELLVGDSVDAWTSLRTRLEGEASGTDSATALLVERLRSAGSVPSLLGP